MSAATPISVLYVDDDHDIRRIVTLAVGLDKAMDLQTCSSGAEALALLANGQWRPDVVLLDVMMPGMNGISLMQAMRTEQGLTDTPVVFITAMGREGDVAGYRKLGAAGIILKPFDPITLAQRIRSIVQAWA